LPSIPQTDNFINAKRLSAIKAGAMLINTARGSVVDEAALFDSLEGGRLAAAALDVFQKEPYVPASEDKDLRKLDNVLLSPHVASNTRQSNDRMATVCLVNIEKFFLGRNDELNRVLK
jgi:lactate dehydrogenase-like 2-hydroxyacid dehydrogenase